MHGLVKGAWLLALTSLCGCSSSSTDAGTPIVAMTFNTGTTDGLLPNGANDGYGDTQAMYSADYYGHGLAWRSVIDDAHAFVAGVAPDVIGFQEIFDPADCAQIPDEAKPGFICETWMPGDPTVAQMVAGDGYQVACHPGHPDKCIAVRRAFATISGCTDDLCPDAMFGTAVPDCGSGARVARVALDLADGGSLTLVNVHGTSGFAAADEACRVSQVEQVFLDAGDGAPAADGARNLILGDFNTDPARFVGQDPSADRWNDFASVPGGPDRPFHFVSPVGEDAPPSYGGAVDIDHMISDNADGDCWISGVTEGRPEVTQTVYFDHLPLVCELALH